MATKDEIRFTLIQLMEENNVKVQDLADYLGVSKQAVSSWRTGKSSIDIERLVPLCSFFDITINEFFGIVNKKSKIPSLSVDERRLMEYYRSLSKPCQRAVLASAKAMSESESKLKK